jgi:hypothetical protein
MPVRVNAMKVPITMADPANEPMVPRSPAPKLEEIFWMTTPDRPKSLIRRSASAPPVASHAPNSTIGMLCK